ncbi:hypothetical protein TRFO_29223 [Tritrichomonas foetus]|uniref:Uncharacterized protein n=1 Tax=Tritrichomonas foetus TaxID=1144522 RepID=A0A1J4K0U5_9EUKA|nr:hypothetical protein TRFO_29223 [Tritrichomonas foetus]|eukprot:OHT03364.1 hypothetical protein TRFO_29223 [Tritrichomonas foetus]
MMNSPIKYKETKNLKTSDDLTNANSLDDEPKIPNLFEIGNNINLMVKFGHLIDELRKNPTVFTLINLNEILNESAIQACHHLIDIHVISSLLNIASENNSDLNMRQNAFFVISLIMEQFPTSIPMFMHEKLPLLLTKSLERPNELFISSVFKVITTLIKMNIPFRSVFFSTFHLSILFHAAYQNLSAQHCHYIVECFTAITQYIEITDIEEVNTIMNIFKLIFIQKLQRNMKINYHSHSYALIGTINLLSNTNIPSDERKELALSNMIHVYVQYYFQGNELTSDKINATILTARLICLNITNIPNSLPNIVNLLQLHYLDSQYHLIIQSLKQIIEFCPLETFQYLIEQLNLVNVIMDIIPRATLSTKIEIYECIRIIITITPVPILLNLIHENLLQCILDLTDLDDKEFTNKIIEDINTILSVFEESGQLDLFIIMMSNIDADEVMENLIQNDHVNEETKFIISSIHEKITSKV